MGKEKILISTLKRQSPLLKCSRESVCVCVFVCVHARMLIMSSQKMIIVRFCLSAKVWIKKLKMKCT